MSNYVFCLNGLAWFYLDLSKVCVYRKKAKAVVYGNKLSVDSYSICKGYDSVICCYYLIGSINFKSGITWAYM